MPHLINAALVGSQKPSLQEAGDLVDPREEFVDPDRLSEDRLVAVSPRANLRVAPPTIRHDRASLLFEGMPMGSTVKIFTVSGRHVQTLQAPAGSVQWPLTNDSGDRAASGIYLYLITDGQGNKIRGKFSLIR